MADSRLGQDREEEPRYSDIANPDFPETKEWKEHVSNWGAHRSENIYGDLSLGIWEVIRQILLVSAINTAAANVLELFLNQAGVLDAIQRFFSYPFAHPDQTIDAVASILSDLWNHPWRTLLSWVRAVPDLIVRTVLLILEPVNKNLPLFLILTGVAVFREVMHFFSLQKKLLGVLRIKFLSRTNLRTVWLGNGQVQFGCGPKGISVEHHYGVTYLLRWEKVDLVYDGDRRQTSKGNSLPFDSLLKLPIHVTTPSGIRVVNPELSASVRDDIEKAKKVRFEEANNNSIRVRLVRSLLPSPGGKKRGNKKHGKVKGEPETELIIPKEVFDLTEPWRWQDFMKACWEYKHFPAAQADGKSIGSISVGGAKKAMAGWLRPFSGVML